MVPNPGAIVERGIKQMAVGAAIGLVIGLIVKKPIIGAAIGASAALAFNFGAPKAEIPKLK